MSERDHSLPAPPRHGADIAEASRCYGIPLSDWLDLSTGINPMAYPISAIDTAAFHHLPIDDRALCDAAQLYVGAPHRPVAAAGSQVLIQWLPLVKRQLAQRRRGPEKMCRVAVPSIGYSEHAFRWQWAGHEIVTYDPREEAAIDRLLAQHVIDVLIVINAHNPLGIILPPQPLLRWHEQLAQREGWLIVDEAFIDPTPSFSIAAQTHRPGLIVLRSLGKFFGLAGVRCGFAFCDETLAAHLRAAVGPWSISGPTLPVAEAALRDGPWQQQMCRRLQVVSERNAHVLRDTFKSEILKHALFNSVFLPVDHAGHCEQALARQGIRVRLVDIDGNVSLLRFGLVDPDDNPAWLRFTAAMQSFSC